MVQLQLPLSSLPTAGMAAGSLRRLEAVHEALDAAITASGLTRAYIAEEISRLTGGSVSENHINNWTAESKMGERHIPLEYVAALTVILGDVRILAAACCPTAGRLIMAVSRGTSTRGWAAPDRPRPAGWCATASIFAWAAASDAASLIRRVLSCCCLSPASRNGWPLPYCRPCPPRI